MSEKQNVVASRYGIDMNVNVGEKVFLSFQPQDAVLVDREEQNADEGHSSSHGGINA